MSLNIKTATGLLEIGGKITKEKIVSALEYVPANETHVEDTDVHITSAERETWNAKADQIDLDAFKEEISQSINSESDKLVIADENGNIIMQVDENGLATTNVNAKTIELNGEDLGVRLDELEATSLPNIIDNESDNLVIADESGNVAVKIDANGLETTTVTAKNVVVDGKDIGIKFDEQKELVNGVSEDLSTHTSNTDMHVTSDEKTLWNNKSDFSGDYNDLKNAPDIVEDESGELVYADESGNVIAKIGENGLETTQVITNKVILSGQDVGSHISNNNIHITSEERTSWNAKADKTYVDNKVASLVDSSPETLDTLNELATALGDDPNFATTVANQIGLKANQTDLDSHTSNKSNPHGVTASQVGLGNVDNTSDANKPVSTAQQTALNNLKDELSESITSENKEWVVTDEDGNIVTRVDENGLETTTVTAQAVVINGVDVETTLSGKANSSHTHSISDITNLDTTLDSKATQTYVDDELAKKSDIGHTHDEYLEASDIEGYATEDYVNKAITDAQLGAEVDLSDYYTSEQTNSAITEAITPYATTEYVNAELDTKASLEHTHDEYLTAIPDDYITEEKLNAKGYLTSIPDEYITETELDAKGYLTVVPNEYITESELNAKGYLTEHQDLSDYAKTTDVNTALGSYYTKTEIDNKGYAVATDVANTYATKTDVDTVLASKVDTTTYGTDKATFATKTDISGKADTSYVNAQLTTKANASHTHTVADITDIASTYLPLAGGTVTGDTIFDSLVTVNDELVVTGTVITFGSTGEVEFSIDGNDNLLVNSSVVLTESRLGVANGVASLDSTGKVPSSQLPSYVKSIWINEDEPKTLYYLQNGEDKSVTMPYVTTTTYENDKANFYVTAGAKSGTTIGECATAEGADTTASGAYSHAEGLETTALGYCSHAGGLGTTANDYQHVIGKYNANTTAPSSLSDTTTSAGLFIVGIGTSDSDLKNGFRVNPAGKVYGTGTFGTSGADYAEYFEWFDGNPDNEDRRGHFVTLEGDKIRYATPNDDYILGVVSADPSVAGDIHSEDWHNRYLKDVFGSKIVEVVEVEETTNENGEIIPAHTERRWVLNPDYDPNVKYTSREERPEWAAIGLVGKLVVVDDGTCQINGYCYPNADGIATASQEKTNYRVMERLDDTHIRIFIK